jgi:hypothetical protein
MVATLEQPDVPLSPELMLPDLLAAHPQTRAVFDRYGLKGCGGRLGPVESISFFARSHGVDETRLLAELRLAIDHPESQIQNQKSQIEDTIYRRFFLGGIILILTAGATWGAWLLWQIGFAGKFTGISIHAVNAHGHAQIFGWVGLFIMGFAYQAFPRIWHTTLVAPRLAAAAFSWMAIGLIIRTIGMTFAGSGSWTLPLAIGGGVLEIVAVLVFVTQILLTFKRSDAKVTPYVGYVVSALVWFVAMSFMCVWHTWTTMTAPDRDTLLWYVATYQAPLRDLQIHGLAMLMILGVSIRMLPALFNVPHNSPRTAWTALAILNVSVIAEAAIFIAYRWTHNHALAALLMLPWLGLAIGCAMVALPWKLWRNHQIENPESEIANRPDRSLKFVRAAYTWLAVSLVMLLLLPVYQVATGIAFSHAYYGAIRHAITVGFISLMIMGFAAKVVPTLNGIDSRTLTSLLGPFILVNVGCFLRCSTQTLTDFHPAFFSVVGISGTLEVAGLTWWGLHLARIMLNGKREQRQDELMSQRPSRIEPDHYVAQVVAWFPDTLDVFVNAGFTPLKNPVLRRTLARTVTIATAARMHNVNLDQLIKDLNAATGPKRIALPQLQPA